MTIKGHSRSARNRRTLAPLAWVALPVFGLGFGVLASGVGIDLLAFAGAGLFLFTLERTIGDWMAEALGPVKATTVFVLAVAGLTWAAVDSSEPFFAAAEKRGYRPAYYRPTSSAATSLDTSSSSGTARAPSITPRAAGADSRPGISADQGGPGEDERAPSREDSAREKPPKPDQIKTAGVVPKESAGTGFVSDSRIVFGPARKADALIPTRATLSLSSAQVALARQVVFQMAVTAEGRSVTEGSIEFIVNGAVVGRVPLGSGAVATTAFATYIPGMYEVRARFSGTTRYEPSLSEVRSLQVMSR